MRKSIVIGLGIAALAIVGGGAAIFLKPNPGSALRACKDDALLVVAVGDIMMGSDTAPAARIAGETSALLKGGSVAVGSLVMTLLADLEKAEVRGPKGGAQHANLLRDWGFSALARANDYANAFGRDGLAETDKILQDNKLVSAGVGTDLAAARAPGWVNTSCGMVAVISAAITLRDLDPNPAIPARAGIAGRPGINPLRVTAVTHVDAETYAKLLASNASIGGPPPDADGTLRAFGVTFVPGGNNTTTTTVNPTDHAEILAAIAEARKTAAAVIVSLGNYETGDKSHEPLPLMETFAREAVAAGASLVVGHGSRTLRAVEFHGGGLIAYGLGDFIADRRISVHLGVGAVDPSVPDVAGPAPEGAVLTASFRDGRVVSARLTALDLAGGQDLPPGFPRLSAAAEVLRQIEEVSAARGAKLTIQQGSADITPIEPTK